MPKTIVKASKELANLIVARLKEIDMSQASLANLVRMHRTHLYRFLEGDKGISELTFQRIVQALDLPGDLSVVRENLENGSIEQLLTEMTLEELHDTLRHFEQLGLLRRHLKHLRENEEDAKAVIAMIGRFSRTTLEG